MQIKKSIDKRWSKIGFNKFLMTKLKADAANKDTAATKEDARE